MSNTNATKEQVESFLKEFKERAGFWGIVYIDEKPNNVDTLNLLDITPKARDKYVLALAAEDYYQGPEPNHFPNQNDVWMFGTKIKGQEIYIKIYISKIEKAPNVCISFHVAEHPLVYPLKKQIK